MAKKRKKHQLNALQPGFQLHWYEIRDIIGADSLAFLSVDGIYRAMGEQSRDPLRPQFTDHCFTGDYPTPLTDCADTEPRQLSLLAEAS